MQKLKYFILLEVEEHTVSKEHIIYNDVRRVFENYRNLDIIITITVIPIGFYGKV